MQQQGATMMEATCLSCFRSHVKCERSIPCKRCLRLGLRCVPNPRPRGRPKKPPGEGGGGGGGSINGSKSSSSSSSSIGRHSDNNMPHLPPHVAFHPPPPPHQHPHHSHPHLASLNPPPHPLAMGIGPMLDAMGGRGGVAGGGGLAGRHMHHPGMLMNSVLMGGGGGGGGGGGNGSAGGGGGGGGVGKMPGQEEDPMMAAASAIAMRGGGGGSNPATGISNGLHALGLQPPGPGAPILPPFDQMPSSAAAAAALRQQVQYQFQLQQLQQHQQQQQQQQQRQQQQQQQPHSYQEVEPRGKAGGAFPETMGFPPLSRGQSQGQGQGQGQEAGPHSTSTASTRSTSSASSNGSNQSHGSSIGGSGGSGGSSNRLDTHNNNNKINNNNALGYTSSSSVAASSAVTVASNGVARGGGGAGGTGGVEGGGGVGAGVGVGVVGEAGTSTGDMALKMLGPFVNMLSNGEVAVERTRHLLTSWHLWSLEAGAGSLQGSGSGAWAEKEKQRPTEDFKEVAGLIGLTLPSSITTWTEARNGNTSSVEEDEQVQSFLDMCLDDDGSAICSAVYSGGRLQLTVNSRFAAMYMTLEELETTIDRDRLRPELVWRRLLSPECASAYDEALCQAYFKGQNLGGEACEIIKCVDRFGLEMPCFMRLRIFASSKGSITASVIFLLPLQLSRLVENT